MRRTASQACTTLALLLVAATTARAQSLAPAPASASADPRWKNMLHDRIGQAKVGGGFELDGYWVWDPSVIKGDDGLYHMFCSRWPKRLPFHPGWMVASEVVHAVSRTVAGPYRFKDVALPARGAQYWDGRATHNPKIVRWKDSYLLFHMGSTHPFDDVADGKTLTLDAPITTVARANKRVGLAVSKSLDGPWTRREAPLLDTRPGTFYSFLTSNPAPLINPDGSVMLLFKSRAYKDRFPFQSDMMIGLARAPRWDGPYTVPINEPFFGVGRVGEVEDPFLWRDETGYHMIAKDQRGDITGHKHAGVLAHSRDGLAWAVDKAPLAYPRDITWSDGRKQTMGQLERPFVFIEDGKMTQMFFAAMDGPGGFANGTRSWNIAVGLRAGGGP